MHRRIRVERVNVKAVSACPRDPQSDGKVELCHRTIKRDCIRRLATICLEDAKRGVEKYVTEYNTFACTAPSVM